MKTLKKISMDVHVIIFPEVVLHSVVIKTEL